MTTIGTPEWFRAKASTARFEAGYAWGREAHATVVYTDLGMTAGMSQGVRAATDMKRTIETRHLPPAVLEAVLRRGSGQKDRE